MFTLGATLVTEVGQLLSYSVAIDCVEGQRAILFRIWLRVQKYSEI